MKPKETFETANKRGNTSRITSANSPPSCHNQDCKTVPPSEPISAKDLTPKCDMKHSDKTPKLWQNGKQLQDSPGELQKNRVELDLEAHLTNLLNQLQSKITKAKEMETTPDTTISTTTPLLKEMSGTWTLTTSNNNSIDLPLTKTKMMRNLMKKNPTMNQKMMMTTQVNKLYAQGQRNSNQSPNKHKDALDHLINNNLTDEQQAALKQGVCFFCKKKGHFYCNCQARKVFVHKRGTGNMGQ
jgi:hypothetical protein